MVLLVQKLAAHSQIAANKATQRTMTLKMLSKFILTSFPFLKMKAAPAFRLEHWRAVVVIRLPC